jgi:hypothetical protein
MNIMTTAGTTPAAPDWLRDLADARKDYEERLGWPVTIELQHRRLVAAVGERMDAITMPAALGRHVLAELQIAMLAGPVIAGPGKWWTFLTEPATAPRPAVPAELFRAKVRITPRGAHVVIPPRPDALEWIKRPQPQHTLPPWSVVIGATRRFAAHITSAQAADKPSPLPAADATQVVVRGSR